MDKSSEALSSLSSTTRVISALAGGEHSLVLTSEGKVYSAGACGLGWCRNMKMLTNLFGWRPVQIPISERVISIYPSYYHNLLISNSGKLYTWGCGTFLDGKNDGCIPALGRPTLEDLGALPKHINLISSTSSSLKAVQITGGAYHSAVLADDGKIYTFGAAQLGQLGRPVSDGKTTDSSGLPIDPTPLPVEGIPSNEEVTKISSGFYSTLAITLSGELYCTGENQNQQCGKQQGAMNLYGLSKVSELEGEIVRDAKGGYCHTLVLTKGGKVFSLGCGDDGQRGDRGEGDAEREIITPVILPDNDSDHVTEIAAGANHSLLLTATGKVYAFGSNEYGQCGLGVSSESERESGSLLSPRLMKLSTPISSVSAGYAHSVMRDKEGRVYMCGQNESGQLGLGEETGDVLQPRQVKIDS